MLHQCIPQTQHIPTVVKTSNAPHCALQTHLPASRQVYANSIAVAQTSAHVHERILERAGSQTCAVVCDGVRDKKNVAIARASAAPIWSNRVLAHKLHNNIECCVCMCVCIPRCRCACFAHMYMHVHVGWPAGSHTNHNVMHWRGAAAHVVNVSTHCSEVQ